MSVFFISDNHFNHKNIIRYEDRPFSSVEEMNEVMVERWNGKVGQNDDIYILGDLVFGNGVQANEIISRLNGRKHLIRGNHDKFFDTRFDQRLLRWVKDYHVLRHEDNIFVLFHYPIFTWDRKHHGAYHLYGHIHSRDVGDGLLGPRSINAGVDVNDFTPLSAEEVLEIAKRREEDKSWSLLRSEKGNGTILP